MIKSTTLSESLDRLLFMNDIFSINILMNADIFTSRDIVDALERKYIINITSVDNEIIEYCRVYYSNIDNRIDGLITIINLIMKNYACDIYSFNIFKKCIYNMLLDDSEDLLMINNNLISQIKDLMRTLIDSGCEIESSESCIYVLLDDVESYINFFKKDELDLNILFSIGSEFFIESFLDWIVYHELGTNIDFYFYLFYSIEYNINEHNSKPHLEKIREKIRLHLLLLFRDVTDHCIIIKYMCSHSYNNNGLKLIIDFVIDNNIIFDEADSYAVYYLMEISILNGLMEFRKGPHKFLTFHPVFREKNIFENKVQRYNIEKNKHRHIYNEMARVYEISLLYPDNMCDQDKILYESMIKESII